jgi:hypothetical protein
MRMIKYFFVLLFFIFFTTSFAQNFDIAKQIEEKSITSYPIDGTHLLEAQNQAVSEYLRNNPDAISPQKLNKSMNWGFSVGDQKLFYADDFTNLNGDRYSTWFTCRAVGNHCYIFVEDSLWNTRVDQAAVDSVQKAFDLSTPANPNKGIYQMDVDAFGNPPDVDNDPKIVILILNIRDGYSGSGGYVAGYFYSYNEILTYSDSNKGEFYYIDANPLNLKSAYGIRTGMSTTAHEFQHMISWNYHKFSPYETFINESCSMLAELNCGFPSYNQSLYANETNFSLFSWRSGNNTLVLNDYSRAQKFSLYLWDQFGIGLFKYIVQSTFSLGPDIINDALQKNGQTLTFNDVFINWLVANTLNDTTVNRSYGYAYSNITKSKKINYYNPNFSRSDTLDNLSTNYFYITGGSNLNINFAKAGSSIKVKAIKKTSNSYDVIDIPTNTPNSFPDYGTTYPDITFIVINTDRSNNQSYNITSSGTISNSAQELKWDTTEPTGYLPLPLGDTVCVAFDAFPGATLDSIKIGLRQAGTIYGGVWKYISNPTVTPLGQKLAGNLVATISTTPSTPYPIPWPNWAKVDVKSFNISTDNPLAVAFAIPKTSPGVMVTEYSGTDFYHSWSYSTTNGRWLYWTSGNNTTYIYLIRAYVSIVTAVGSETVELMPKGFSLSQNYPNPFNPSTNITYNLADREFVTLKVYDLLGNEVATIVNEEKPAGSYNVPFSMDKLKLSSGTYFYRLQAGNFVETKKMILLK